MKRVSLTIAAMSLLPLLAGCPNPGPPDAIVHWHKVGACNGGQGQSGNPSTFYNSGPNAAYVIFAIDSIDNSQVAQAWIADPTRFHVGSSSFDPLLMIYHWVLEPFAMVSTAIPAGTNYGFSPSAYGALVVSTSSANGADEANATNYQLLYTPTAGDPGVIMEETGSGVTTDFQDCGSVSLH